MRALISVSDKTGIVEFAHALTELGFELVSTGGTSKTLKQAEITNVEISDFTGFPEILEGRVKTLHPKVFGGILFQRANPKHKSDVDKHDIPAIDWVIVNLYPFEKIHLENKIPKAEMIEFIDVGGVSLLRAAAKNFTDLVVLCDPQDYAKTLEEYKENKSISLRTRQKLAAKAFGHTAHYDSMIAKFFAREESLTSAKPPLPQENVKAEIFPAELTVGLKKIMDLRYGENPQQKAALYQESGDREWGVVHAEKLQGKELSFNNYLDLDAAWQIVNSLSTHLPSANQQLKVDYNGSFCVIIKHTNPCGAAMGQNSLQAFQLAYGADPLSAFGGIVGFSKTVDQEAAEEIGKSFFECVIAPDFTDGALEVFKKKANLRLLRQKTMLTLPYELDFKKISGGMLVQQKDFAVQVDKAGSSSETRKTVSKRQPTPEEVYSLEFAWQIAKHVKSNAIVLSRGTTTQGVGAGQMSRVDALRAAIQKMRELQAELNPVASGLAQSRSNIAKMPLVLASDAFFPFRDCIDEAAKAGISAVIQPGGSIRDQESVDAANEHNMALVFTGIRHFKH